MRILVLSGNAGLRRFVADALDRTGFQVVEACDPGRALSGSSLQWFDGLVLDASLPGVSAFELVRQLRLESSLALVMLTAQGDKEQLVRALQAGADDCLSQPLEQEEVVARIGAVLRRVPREPDRIPESLHAGGLQLYPSARIASFKGKRCELTFVECEILSELIQARGQVVSRDRLSLRLYHRPATHLDRAVDTHVSRIRRKIGLGRMISSIRGTGYQLVLQPDRD